MNNITLEKYEQYFPSEVLCSTLSGFHERKQKKIGKKNAVGYEHTLVIFELISTLYYSIFGIFSR